MCLMQGKKSRNWGYEDITRAIVLRAISRKAYTYFRDKLRFPLLSLSTHQRWCRSFQCRPGVIEGAITVLKMQGQTMTPRKKNCRAFIRRHEYRLATRVRPRRGQD